MKLEVRRLSVLAATLALAVAGCTLPDWLPFSTSHATSTVAAAAQTQPVQIAAANPAAVPVAAPTRALPDFSALVESEGPAVVNISVTGYVKTGGMPDMSGLDEDDPFFQFFKRFRPNSPQEQQRIPQRGIGSGFIISP